MSDFIAETREMLDAIAGELVAWEGDPGDRARLDAIFRFVHTVKGSCGFLDLPRLARLSHAAEDVLADVRAGRRAPDAALVSGVLAVVDRIGEVVAAIESGAGLDDSADHRLVAALQPGRNDPGPAAPAPAGQRGQARTIRLPIELLDRLMCEVSDMVLARNELARRLREEVPGPGVEGAFDRLSARVADLRDAVSRTRMQRLDHLFSALPRMVRDLASELGREVVLELDGGDVELDREMIECIRDPLAHIIRNAIDHGIEPPARRSAAGKAPAGRLRISARQSGNQIIIEASDDGAGIDADAVASRAVQAGLLPAAEAATLSRAAKLDLIFTAGLSTAAKVTEISGRGVGMDVVRANIERIGGLAEVDSQPGAGTRLILRVPLTLTIIPALTVSIGGDRFAIPRPAIEEIVRVGAGAQVATVAGARLATVRGRRMPLVCGAEMFGAGVPGTILVVLRPAGSDVFALSVDAAHDHEELVVKPAAPIVMATGIYAGTTLPDSGRPMLLLDCAGIARRAGIAGTRAPVASTELVAEETPRVPTLLFRDLDAVQRAVRLSIVQRIEDVPAEAIRFAGRLHLSIGDRLLPLLALGALPDQGRLRVLLLSDGAHTIGYAIDSVIDIVPLGPTEAPAAREGPVAGALLVTGQQVELLDAHWLFANGTRAEPTVEPPLCLLPDADDGWARNVLAPLVAAAGYRVAFSAHEAGGVPDLIVTQHGEADDQPEVPRVRLRCEPQPAGAGDRSIYRYDRPGLLAALADCARRFAT